MITEVVDFEAVDVTHLWWNGADRESPTCAFLSAGTLPDGRWVVEHGGNRTAFVFDHGEDAIGVARHMTIGWIRVPASFGRRDAGVRLASTSRS